MAKRTKKRGQLAAQHAASMAQAWSSSPQDVYTPRETIKPARAGDVREHLANYGLMLVRDGDMYWVIANRGTRANMGVPLH